MWSLKDDGNGDGNHSSKGDDDHSSQHDNDEAPETPSLH